MLCRVGAEPLEKVRRRAQAMLGDNAKGTATPSARKTPHGAP